MEFNQYIDHTNLKPTATSEDIRNLCREAIEFRFYAVCVNGNYVQLAKSALNYTPVKVAAVIGFPLGAMTTTSKIFEARECIENGADEIDMVINVGWLKAGDYSLVKQEIADIKAAIGKHILKVIIETCFLSEKEKIAACEAALKAGADFLKTSTGFGTGGATIEDVKLMNEIVQGKMHIKASGGVKSRKAAQEFIEAGATRLGTSSGVALVKENKN